MKEMADRRWSAVFFVGKPATVNSLKFGKYDIYGFGNHESAGL